ncbi:transposase, partial [Staphylococcus sp. EZ-P03]
FDRFHIVQHMNRELNFYRREVMNRYKDKEGREYPVLKNKWRLLLTDKRKLFMMDGIWDGSFRCYKKGYDLVNFMLQTDEKLKNSYELVHDLRESLKLCNWKDFINRLNDVDKNSISKNIWKVVTFFRKHQEILRNTIYNPLLNNGAIEGINNKIKLIKRISYGYRSFNNLRNRIMLVFSLFKNKKKKTTRPVHRMVV